MNPQKIARNALKAPPPLRASALARLLWLGRPAHLLHALRELLLLELASHFVREEAEALAGARQRLQVIALLGCRLSHGLKGGVSQQSGKGALQHARHSLALQQGRREER